MKIKFYKKNKKWYADLPQYIESGGKEEDCEMVFGADEWLDLLSKNSNEIELELSSTNPLSEKIVKYQEDEYGATYMAHTFKEEDINHQLWICPVTLFVFNEYPETIYYSTIN